MLDVRKKVAILPLFPIESYVLFLEVFLQFDGVKLIGLRAFSTTFFLLDIAEFKSSFHIN